MKRRAMFAGAFALAATPAFARSGTQSAATFVVPKGVTKLRVRSYRGDSKVIDTMINVLPGQLFRIDSV